MMADIRFFLEMGRRSLGKDETLDIGLSAGAEDLGQFSRPKVSNLPTTATPGHDDLKLPGTPPWGLSDAHFDRQADQVGGALDTQLRLDLAAGVGDRLVADA